MIAQLQPKVLIVLPPVHKPHIGETVQFQHYCFGRDRLCTGVVVNIDHIAPIISYQCQLPSEAQCRSDYRYPFKYPKGGIHRGEVQLPLEQIRPYDGHQLSINDRAEITHDAIALLEAERDQLLREGSVALQGAELRVMKCHHRKGFQVQWKADKAIFPGKRKPWVRFAYVGMKGSPEHAQAIAARARRNAIASINRQLEILEGLSDD